MYQKLILTLLKICCCNKRNVTMTKIRCNSKGVYTRHLDVPQKALSERSHFYVIGGNLK